METSAKNGLETSAKNGLNVNELFCKIGMTLYNQTLKNNEIDKVRKYKYIIIYNDKIQNVDSVLSEKLSSEKKRIRHEKTGCC